MVTAYADDSSSSKTRAKLLKKFGLPEGWDDDIRNAIHSLFRYLENDAETRRKPFNDRDYFRYYTACYELATKQTMYDGAEQLYKLHERLLSTYLTETVLKSLKEKNGDILFRELGKSWSNQKIINRWMSKFSNYIDRYYVKQNKLKSVGEKGVDLFKSCVFDKITEDVIGTFIETVQKERKGEVVDKGLLKDCFTLFKSMGVDMEEPLLAATREFYRGRRERWIAVDSTPEYLIKVENILEEEKKRSSDYLNSSCEAKILAVVDEELLEAAILELVDKQGSGCTVLLANDKYDDLRRMFRLFSRIQKGLDPVADSTKKFIAGKCDECIEKRKNRLSKDEGKSGNDDPEFIKSLLSVLDKYRSVVNDTFSNHRLFRNSLEAAFVDAVNKDISGFKTAVVVSTFCDSLLKSGGEKMSETDVEKYLTEIVHLFNYIKCKDIFADAYRNQLAKRLLNVRSMSIEMEKIMISKLKVQCGTQLTNKMEGMLSDLAVGTDIKNDFYQEAKQLKGKGYNQIDFSVQVLTRGFWPTYKSPDIVLSSQMESCMTSFKLWYNNREAKKKLTLISTLGDCTVRGTFGKKTYGLQVTTLQAVALEAFSGGKKHTLSDIGMQLKLEQSILKPLMHSLCKSKVISKSPPSFKNLSMSDSFKANAKFTNARLKFRIPMASLDSTHNPKRIEEDRSIAIEASIVRVMKARKTLTHNQLIAEVSKQLTLFNPSVRVIKHCIESLIDREYLERDEDVRNSYKYLA